MSQQHPTFEATNPPVRLLAAFYELYPGRTPEVIARAPGRDMWAAALRTNDETYTVIVPDLGGKAHFSRRSAITRRTVLNRPLPHWARFPAGVVIALSDAGFDASGFEAVLVGDEPQGPRYEYALGVTVAALWHDLLGLPYIEAGLVEFVEQARREYVEG